MNNHINNLFQACTPNEEQKDKIFHEILNKKEEINYNKIRFYSKGFLGKKILRPVFVGIICLVLGIGIFTFLGESSTFVVYAYGSDTQITDTGFEFSTGVIHNDGKMQGQLMQLYVKGDNIDTIRYSCKNQYLDFTDWTESRTNYSVEKQFTVSYGKKESDYSYLVINWNPDNTIRKLTDNANSTINNIGEELKNDIIVMEVTFMDGSTLVKAINITLQDNGKIMTKLQDYVVTNNDSFILNPEKVKPSQEEIDKDNELQINNFKHSEIAIEEAKEVVKKYYSNFSGEHEIVAIEYTENSNLLSDEVINEYKGWDIIEFKAYEKSMYPQIARTILMAKENSKKEWIVINEGY